MEIKDSNLTIRLHPDCIVLPEAIRSGFQVEYDTQTATDEVSISPEAAFLIFTRISLPTSPAQLVQRLYRFVDAYSSGICIMQNFPEILDQRPSKLIEVLHYLAFEHRISIIPSRTSIDTALCIQSLAKRIQIRDNPPKITRLKSKPKTILDAQKHLLEGLVNCGSTKVETLIKPFTSPMAIFSAIQNADIIFTKTGRIKAIDGAIGEIAGIGPEFVVQNQHLLSKKGNKNNPGLSLV